MPSLGSPGEFDPNHRYEPEPQPENPDGPRRDIEEEMAAQADLDSLDPEAPTADELEQWRVSEDAEHQEADEQLAALQNLILGAAPGGRDEYFLLPEHLAMFVHHGIMETDEARDYLRSRGISLR